ncbi:MAG: hypothetical protein JWQ80_2550 [Massilia sp.]|nr:hypothetical protein [Massilia sp.]
MEQANSRTALFKEDFLRRVGEKNVLHAAAWLFLYTTPLSALLAAVILTPIVRYSPELAATLGIGAGPKNIS